MLFKILLWLDIKVLWILTAGRSRNGETISAAAWSLHCDGKWQGALLVPMIDGLFYFVQKDHCRKAWLWQQDIYK